MTKLDDMIDGLTIPEADTEEIVPTSDPLGFVREVSMQGGLSYVDSRGRTGVAVPQSEEEAGLLSSLARYDEKTRGMMLDLRGSLGRAKDISRPLEAGDFPGELDDSILELIDMV
jgi:hypothetical protein